MMETKECTKNPKRDIIISIRINKDMSKFIKKNNLAPSYVFLEALKELGYKENIKV